MIPSTAHRGGDERIRQTSRLRKFLRRPEFGAAVGAVLIWLIFALAAGNRGFLSLRGTANYLEVAAELGILAIAVSLLMIGGEFDLSIGSIIGASGMTTAILSAHFGWHVVPAIAVSLMFSLVVGFINGILVVRTRLPSFIITLGSLFALRGLTIGLTRLITGRTQVGGLKLADGYDLASSVFAQSIAIPDPASLRGDRMLNAEFSVSILWWVLIAVIATYVLLRTRAGNWILGIGGDPAAARNLGVPVGRMKIILFMTTAAAAWMVATIQVLTAGSADALRGEQREFFAIIAVVIGGTLLTGGYGSAIGAVLGALIYGMVQQGIVFAGVDSDWFLVVMGVMLVVAVLVNNVIRRRAAEAK